MVAPTKNNLGGYARKAFLQHWNLLVFGGAVVFGAISGFADIVLPLVLAGEIGYLGFLSTNPKFQKAMDAQDHAAKQLPKETEPQPNRLDNLLTTLNGDRNFRFSQLRDRCVEMQRIASRVRGHGRGAGDALHAAALNKMLWVFARLLGSQQGLEKFLETTDALAIKRRVSELETRIAKAEKDGNDKILRALIDSVATANLRVDNLATAQHNAEFVEIELDRIEDKIKALVEMAVSHEDPDFISSQVDSVAQSVSDTEQVMREMSFIPGVNDGIEEEEESTPSILSVSA